MSAKCTSVVVVPGMINRDGTIITTEACLKLAQENSDKYIFDQDKNKLFMINVMIPREIDEEAGYSNYWSMARQRFTRGHSSNDCRLPATDSKV